MVFKPKFFLDLGSEGERQKPVTVAPVVARPEPKAPKAEPGAVVVAKGPAAPGAAAASVAAEVATAAAVAPAAGTTGSLTTAEAIAAELAADQANRPAPSLATFAPDCVAAGGGLPQRRRRGSADLGGFREMARGMMRS
ncbi:MAG: hypothetical protein WCF98_01860 [Synechococcus sp. ELA057]